MKKTVFMFPGQGSQFVGMGLDLHQEYDYVRELFDMAEDLCRLHIRRLCFEGPMDVLTLTENLQPAVTAVNLACLAVLTRAAGITPDMAAGHSLGEYSALCAAGVLRAEDVFLLVNKRGRLMHREACKHPGAMAAVMGLEMAAVEAIVSKAQAAGTVSVANHNTPAQIVITGSVEGVEKACALAAEQKGKAIPLKVSGAWHSQLMEGAREEFAEYLTDFEFRPPQVPVVMNVTGQPCTDPGEMRRIMAVQLVSPVRWCDCLSAMQAQNMERFVEVGPKNVLSGMARKTLNKEIPFTVCNVEDMKTLAQFIETEG